MSVDSINDVGYTAAGVNILGDVTMVWVGKMKSTYDVYTAADPVQMLVWFDAQNYIRFYYTNSYNALCWRVEAQNSVDTAQYTTKPAIDDYLILIGTYQPGVGGAFFVNGSRVDGIVSTQHMVAGAFASAAYLGRYNVGQWFDISKCLFACLIDGAFTYKQALAFSRWLKDVFNLPILV
ncbi:hypothetical protein ES703_111333 [subsurface metagenome]